MMVMFLRKTEFKALKDKSTRLSGAQRDTTLSTVLFETLNKVFGNIGRNLGGENTTTLSHIPPIRLL